MDLQGIRYFVEICRAGSFTKAAQSCFVSEPALSRKIRKLEQNWGVKLFVRTTHSVTLTEEGQALWEEAERLLGQYEMFQKKIQSLNGRRALKIGYSSKGEKIYLEKLVQLASGQLLANIEMKALRPVECVRQLESGQLDAALLTEPMLQAQEELEGVRICVCGIGAFLPVEWELAGEKELSVCQLADCPIVTFPRQVAPAAYDKLISLAGQAGVALNVVAEVTNTMSFWILIEEEKEVGLMMDTSRIVGSDKVLWRPIREFAGEFNLMLAWPLKHPMADMIRQIGLLGGKIKD